MDSQPRRQQCFRPHVRRSRAGRVVEEQATLAARLTPRDRWLLAMLHEHRTLTTQQIARVAWPSADSARRRVLSLHHWGVLDRARPTVAVGSAPWHLTLAPAGARALAAGWGLTPRELGWNHERAAAVTHHHTLAHTLGVADFGLALIEHAHQHARQHARQHGRLHGGEPATAGSGPIPAGSAALTAWWGQTRCAALVGDMTHPDAWLNWRVEAHGRPAELAFFLEYDLATNPARRTAARLSGYAELARATGVATPVLVWVPTLAREAPMRRALREALMALDEPRAVPVATAPAQLLNPPSDHPSAHATPADPVWAPLVEQAPRMRLHELAGFWRLPPAPPVPGATASRHTSPQLGTDTSTGTGTGTDGGGAEFSTDVGVSVGAGVAAIPAPAPMPPLPAAPVGSWRPARWDSTPPGPPPGQDGRGGRA